MKALSIRQPWAWLIVHGLKDVENRTWAPNHRGDFYVHAAKSLYGTIEERERIRQWVWERFDIELPEDDCFERGGIVGRAEAVVVVKKSLSPWFMGPYGLIIENAKPLPFRKYSGRLGFFDVK